MRQHLHQTRLFSMQAISQLLLFFLSGLFVSGCVIHNQQPLQKLDPAARILILSAFDAEMQQLQAETEIEEMHILNGRTYVVGRLGGHDVVLGLSGVSMVNAAMTTQLLLDHFEIRAILFSGIAGGVNPKLSIGDVVIPARWGQYQEQIFARESGPGWDLGWHSENYQNFGMMFPQEVAVTRRDSRPDHESRKFWFDVDAEMLTAAQSLGDMELDNCVSPGKCLPGSPQIRIGGNGVSGPTFVDNGAYREYVWETFRADALDMESAAVAHVAYVNRTPFLIIRSLSDLAGGGPGENEIGVFFQLAADNSTQVLLAFLQAWPQ